MKFLIYTDNSEYLKLFIDNGLLNLNIADELETYKVEQIINK